jgi:pimeloyl-ACP methyl ester carboxylesterase
VRAIGDHVYVANPKWAPLLPVVGESDRGRSIVRTMYPKHRKAPAAVELIEFPAQSHFLIAESGGEQIAGAILAWTERSTQ